MIEVRRSREFLIGYAKSVLIPYLNRVREVYPAKSVLILYLNRDRGIFNSITIKEREKRERERPNYLQSCLLNRVDPSLLEART